MRRNERFPEGEKIELGERRESFPNNIYIYIYREI